tara:strand:- start:3481 stop:3669 length:189 start_codon:yes stop_codon:yes gene_type:complete
MSKTMCCSICKQDNLAWRVWVDELDNIVGDCEDTHAYCNDCEDQTKPMFKEERSMSDKGKEA